MARTIKDQWIQDVKDTHQLTVFPTPRMLSGRWGPIYRRALDEFNRLSDTYKLGVKMIETQQPPDTEGFMDAGANVQFDVSGSTPKFRYRAKDWTSETYFSATSIMGLTEALSQGGRMTKAFIFMPMYPLADDQQREVGDGVKLFIAVHELVHAAGCLDNEDHSPESNPDVFCGPPVSNPQFLNGSTPDEDKVSLKSGQLIHNVFTPGVKAPPITLSHRTTEMIQKRWK